MNNVFKFFCLWSVVCGLLSASIFSIEAFAYNYSKSLDSALTLLLQEDYDLALNECNLLESNSKKELKGEIMFLKGTCFMKLDMYEEARNVFKKALPFSGGNLSAEVYMGIADSYFMQQKYEEAIVIYEQLLNKINDSDVYFAALYYKLGKSYQKGSEWAKTKYYFDLLENKFPNSFELQLVKKTAVGGNFFTIQVGCFYNQKNAEKLQNDLKVKGYDVYVTPFEGNGSRLYRVRVGEFMSQLAAEHTEAVLRSKEHLPTHIFP